jgi:hypothetical protein
MQFIHIGKNQEYSANYFNYSATTVTKTNNYSVTNDPEGYLIQSPEFFRINYTVSAALASLSYDSKIRASHR